MYDTLDLRRTPDLDWVEKNCSNARQRFHRFFILGLIKGRLEPEEYDLVFKAKEMEEDGLVSPLVLRGVRIIVSLD